VTLKVLPRAPDSRTLMFFGLADEAAVGVMCAAMATPFEVSGTLHLYPSFVSRLEDKSIAPLGSAVTALRIEGMENIVASRIERLRKDLAPFGETYELTRDRSLAFWSQIRAMAHLVAEDDRPLWRISTAPSKAAPLVRALASLLDLSATYDWSGGLIWVEVPPSADASATEVRRVLAEFGADATLMRAPRQTRASVDVFHPMPLARMHLVQSVKRAFDPSGILNPGRMYAGV
jgi:glycolate oxidase FAD binding subunit